jgi:hypothetical protein
MGIADHCVTKAIGLCNSADPAKLNPATATKNTQEAIGVNDAAAKCAINM